MVNLYFYLKSHLPYQVRLLYEICEITRLKMQMGLRYLELFLLPFDLLSLSCRSNISCKFNLFFFIIWVLQTKYTVKYHLLKLT